MAISTASAIRQVMTSVLRVLRLTENKRSNSPRRRTFLPQLELLEAIEAPAVVLTWVGVNNAPWSAATSWADADNNPVTPTADDTLFFDGNVNNISRVDEDFQGSIANVSIDPTFTGTIKLERTLTVATSLIQNGGTIDGAFTLTVNTGFVWAGGTLKGNGDDGSVSGNTDATSNVILNGNANVFSGSVALDGRIIKNFGTTVWNAPANEPLTISAYNNAEIRNGDSGTISTTGADVSNFTGDGEFYSAGNLGTAAMSTMRLDVPSTVDGGLILSDGTVAFNKAASFIGTESVGGGGTISFAHGAVDISGTLDVNGANVAITMASSSPLTISGKLLLHNAGSHSLNGSVTLAGTVIAPYLWVDGLAGLVLNNSFTLNNGSADFTSSAGVTSTYGLTVAAGTTITNTGGFTIGGSGGQSITGAGTFSNSGNFFTTSTGEVTISANFANTGNLELWNGTTVIPTSWTQGTAGSVRLQGGSFQVNGTFYIDGLLHIGTEGEVNPTQAYIYADSVVNAGTISFRNVGVGSATPVQLAGDVLRIAARPDTTNSGNFTQTSTGQIEMYLLTNSTTLGVTGCDSISIAGKAGLAGTLNVLVNAFLDLTTVLPNQEWVLVTADSFAPSVGSSPTRFDTINKPSWILHATYFAACLWVDNNTSVVEATPIIDVTGGGTFTGAAVGATATVAGIVNGYDNTPASSLEGVTPALAYYTGTDTTATPLAGAPTSAGTYTVVASFTGSVDYVSATKDATFTITQATPVTALTFSANPADYGASVSLTATVAAGYGTPTGDVSFYEDSTLLGTDTLNSSGFATISISTLSIGIHTIRAEYAGDSNFNSSSGSADLAVGASIGNFVWNDTDHDGIQDSGEAGKSGVMVKLYDNNSTLLATTTTDSTGHYHFVGLAAGDYLIQLIAPTLYVFSSPYQGSDDTLDSDVDATSGETDVFSLGVNEHKTDIDAGMYFGGNMS